jgi:NagD protein
MIYDAYIFDLDGTVYLGDALLPTAGETIAELRRHGKRTVFLSNNPTHSRADYRKKLERLGLPTPESDIVNSSVVMVDFLKRMREASGANPRLFVCGETPLCNDLQDAGFELVQDAKQTDVVIASFDRTFLYRKLQIAFDAIRNGARFFATNGDRYCPVPGGGEPDAASIIAAIEACTNVKCEAIVGKPSKYMVDAILAALNDERRTSVHRSAKFLPQNCVMIGDRLETDVKMGLDHGMGAALTLTGATTREMLANSDIKPHHVLERLEDLLVICNQ